MKSDSERPRTYNIILTGLELGQILDGFDQRFEAWRNTAEYRRTGRVASFYEPQAIAGVFKSIIANIRRQ